MTREEQSEPSKTDDGIEPHRAPAPSRRLLRAMAILRWALLVLVTVLAGYTVWTTWGPKRDAHTATEHARYYCPMHPQIRSPEPGECPICHMNLEPIPEERQAQSSTSAPLPASGAAAAPAPIPEVAPVTLSAEKQQAVGVVTTLVETATLGHRLRVPGVISAPETGLSQVRVRAAGFVERVAVRQTGVRVSKGQPLVYVYSPEIYRAQEEFIAASRWSGSASGDRTALGGATDLVSAARRGLELLGLTGKDIEEIVRTGHPIRAIAVRAPAGGFVTRFNAVLGSRADPDMVLYEISDLSSVWVIASVHERDLGDLRVGALGRFTSASLGATNLLTGRADLIEPLVDESTRTTRVRLVVENRDGHLRPGQFGEVEFELAASPGVYVPRDAVIRTGEHEYVYVVAGMERFEPRLVTTGAVREGRVQVVSGLLAGERVVMRGSFMLDSESRLQASLAAAPVSSSRGVSSEMGSSCESDFDRQRYADKYAQCQACERQHAGMGGMVSDCKNAIAKPWK